MKIKALITEDTTSEYLDRLHKTITEHEVSFAGDIAEEFGGRMGTHRGHIPKHMSTTFNPYLYRSGADNRYWHVTHTDGLATIEMLYTGERLNQELAKPLVWWEFATKDTRSKPPRERTLARDYAYFQETGIDEEVPSKFAKHKHAIQKGLSEASEKDLAKPAEYLILLMEGKWVGTRDDFYGSRL